MRKRLFFLLISCLTLFSACRDNGIVTDAEDCLIVASDSLVFSVPSDASMFIKSMQIFEDEKSQKYFAFMSNDFSCVYFYDITSRGLVKTLQLQNEGPDGIGRLAYGFYVKDWDNIYIPDMGVSQISVVDSSGHKQKSFIAEKMTKDYPFIPTYSLNGMQIVLYDNQLYAVQAPNRRLGNLAKSESTTEMVVDLVRNRVSPFSFCYPPTIMSDYSPERIYLGIERSMSRCFNGKELVYSFGMDENLYTVSLDDGKVMKHFAKSRFIDELKTPKVSDDLAVVAKRLCEYPFYGNIYYDKYRRLYYRVVYPQEEYEKEENFVDLWQFGRGKFSIIVLNEDFEVLGETFFPAYDYRSDLVLILEDGVYLSTSHYKNSSFDEDKLVFKRFEVVL